MSETFTIVSVILVLGMDGWWLKAVTRQRSDLWLGLGVLMSFPVVGAALGSSGALSDFSRFPPPALFMLLGITAACLAIVLSSVGGRIAVATPLRFLVGMQAFRFLPEILLDLAYRDGLAPIQMTWHGRNFDVLSAIFALVLLIVWPRLAHPRLWAWLHSVVAIGLLLNILAVAVLSMPTPFRVFTNEPANTFVTTFPYIGLPMVHVATAIVLHGLTLRRLLTGPMVAA